jgi:hypothetical protein
VKGKDSMGRGVKVKLKKKEGRDFAKMFAAVL